MQKLPRNLIVSSAHTKTLFHIRPHHDKKIGRQQKFLLLLPLPQVDISVTIRFLSHLLFLHRAALFPARLALLIADETFSFSLLLA
jgi:hypothetical protein